MSPVAGVDANGKVVAAWLRIKDPAFSGTITTLEQLPLFYKQLEVVSSVFDPSTGSWSAITTLTDDLALDTSLRLSSDSTGKLLLTWQSNPSGEFNADNANPATLKYSFWNGSSWKRSRQTVVSNLTNISEQAAAVRGNNAFIILPQDPNLDATNDRNLLVYNWNGTSWSAANTFAGGGVDNFLPSVVYDSAGQGQIVWLRGADMVQATLSNPTPNTVRAGSNSMAFYNAQLMTNAQGNLTLVWQEVSDQGAANIFVSIYDVTSQTWSADIRLNEDTRQASNASGYYGSDGKLQLVYLATQINRVTKTVTINGQTVQIPNIPENGQTDINLLEYTLGRDLAVKNTDIVLSTRLPDAGQAMTADVKVHNTGSYPLNNFAVKLYAGYPSPGGVLVGSAAITSQLPAGATRTANFSFNYPGNRQNIVAVVDANNEINEVSEINNTAITFLANNEIAPFDFDGDGKTDIAIFRPPVGEWWINRSSSGQTVAAQFGESADKPVPVDFTGDDKVDIAFWRPASGFWFVLRSEDGSFFSFPFGTSGDIPVPADYDGDGIGDACVFRPSTGTWYILNSGGGTSILNFGTTGDFPVPADFDGDGKADPAIFRPGDGSWWYLRSSDFQFRVYRFGVSTDKPVQGDYTGDGKADLAVFRPVTGEWYVQRSEDDSFYSVPWGTNGDAPTPGDYDGDGKFDTAVFRPTGSTWFINRTTAGVLITSFGSSGDQPIPGVFVP